MKPLYFWDHSANETTLLMRPLCYLRPFTYLDHLKFETSLPISIEALHYLNHLIVYTNYALF